MKKTFCIVNSHYFPHPGGTETYTKNLSNELVKLGYRVIILTHNLNNGYNEIDEENANKTIIRLEAHLLLNSRLPIVKNNKINKKLFDQLKRMKIDYFVINTRFYRLSRVAAKFANNLGIKPVLIDHGSAHLVLGNKIADSIVAATEHFLTYKLKKYKIAYYGISASSEKWLKHFNIQPEGIIPNAINADEFRKKASGKNYRKLFNIPKDAFIVYFLGRCTIEKGVPQLLKVVKSLEKYDDIYFIFTGKGPLSKNITELSKYYNTVYTGELEACEIASIMKQSNVFCLPSRSEGFCLALLEAASCKLPPIISRVGIAEDLILNLNYGYILNNNDEKSIAEAIKYCKITNNWTTIAGNNIYNEAINKYNWTSATNAVINACKSNNEN